MKQYFFMFFILMAFISNAQRIDLSTFMTDTTLQCTYTINRQEIDSNCRFKFYINPKIKKAIDSVSIIQGSGNAVLFPSSDENGIFQISFYEGLCTNLSLHKTALYKISYNYLYKEHKKEITIILW